MPKPNVQKVQKQTERAKDVYRILLELYPTAKCSLDHAGPLELLVATILSAQCTDERVNVVTKDLFKRYRSAADYAKVDQETLEKEVQPTGFFRNKAKSIRGMAQMLMERHGGKVPQEMEQLVELPGVGRKTANVVLGNAFKRNVGVVVDTHVGRLAQRLGFTKHTDPEKIEQDLMVLFPRETWALLAHLLIYHGRAICKAARPACEVCPLLTHCPTGPKVLKEREAAKRIAKKR